VRALRRLWYHEAGERYVSDKKHPPISAQMGFLTVDYLMSL